MFPEKEYKALIALMDEYQHLDTIGNIFVMCINARRLKKLSTSLIPSVGLAAADQTQSEI